MPDQIEKLRKELERLKGELRVLDGRHENTHTGPESFFLPWDFFLGPEKYLPQFLREGWQEVQKIVRICSSELAQLTKKVHDWEICCSRNESNILLEECFWIV
ncbi:TPA: hypothetical protein HA338_06215 [Methanosarcina acetivorans]|uniref:Uncharacterized protein n=1 Tax=Methanosarcina acetivorans TaxID=2214 RepID=A0A832W9V3_9EURY|nr:hypothetical protein [Methanosarcina acetivorans]HIH93635.1 hypothetical protein [Methanosarcina acetivorans]